MGIVDDRVVLVTGGGGGIGRAASLAFAREGAAHVVVADFDPSTAASTVEQVEEAGGSASVWEVDVTDEEAVAAWWPRSSTAMGALTRPSTTRR